MDVGPRHTHANIHNLAPKSYEGINMGIDKENKALVNNEQHWNCKPPLEQ